MKKDIKKKDKLPFKQRLFNRMLEKPINDILYVSYELYMDLQFGNNSIQIVDFDSYCNLVNSKLKEVYNPNIEEV